MKDVGASDSEDEQQAEQEKSGSDEVDGDLSEDEAEPSKVKAYNALLESLKQPKHVNAQGIRQRKRRKLEVKEVEAPADDASSQVGTGEEAGVEVESEDSEASDDEKEPSAADRNAMLDGVEDDDEEDESDPFEVRFASPDDNELSRRLQAVQANQWRTDKTDVVDGGKLTISVPASVEGKLVRKRNISNVADITLKKRLAETAAQHIPRIAPLQQAVAPYMLNYQDLFIGNRTPANAESLRTLVSLHALNHVLKGRDKVLKNAAKLAASDVAGDLDLRDQGFTRPKVLILTETRQQASKYADSIVQLFAPEQQENKARFESSFKGEVDDTSTMPEDYLELFGGNNDNNFLTAMKFTRKTLKFYSAFYTSDIILASPLGLRRIIENEDKRKQDYDFLSSIEICIVDQADAMQMQSWQNVEVVFEHLNLQPKDLHGADVSRIRQVYLDGHAKSLRQTIIFSAYITPEMNSLFNKYLLNVAGKVKLQPSYDGAITRLGGVGVKQTFSRFPSVSPASDPDERFKYFTTAVLPSLLRLPKPADGAQGVLLFIPSYYDFLRLRNHFATSTQTQNMSFGAIHDYTEVSDQRRARSHFLSGRHSFLLYTQRAHHFFRLKIRSVKRVVLYGLPDNAIFYEELVGGMLGTTIDEGRASAEECGVRALFSKWDGLRLERVVGTSRVKGMLAGQGDTFDFV